MLPIRTIDRANSGTSLRCSRAPRSPDQQPGPELLFTESDWRQTQTLLQTAGVVEEKS